MRTSLCRSAGTRPVDPVLRFLGCFLLVLACSCSPKIVAFHAEPVRLCVGQSVELTWEVEGDALLAATPAVSGAGAVDSTGARSFTLQQATTFRLTATRRGKEGAPQCRGVRGSRAAERKTFAGIVELNDRRKGDLEQFLAGVKLLAQGAADNLPDDDLIASVFDQIKYIAKQSHHIRAIGYYLDQLADATGVGAQIERTASINDGDTVIVFGPDVERPA